ncbi:MAG: hypothetical protein KDH15_15555 [Rhodocyclaceae bacterium]|nr:hypothetical protein [Rhodocyclaceae bacterium]
MRPMSALLLPSLLCALLPLPNRSAVAAEFATAVTVNIDQARVAPSLVSLAEALFRRQRPLATADGRGGEPAAASNAPGPSPDLLAKLVMHRLATGH